MISPRLLFAFGIALGLIVLRSGPVLAQEDIEIRLADGSCRYIDRPAESRGHNWILYFKGEAAPRTVPKRGTCIGRECCTGAPRPDARAAPTPSLGPISGRISIHGSNTIGAKLMRDLISRFGFLRGASVDFRQTAPEEHDIILSRGSETGTITLHSHGSNEAFTGLTQGKAIIGMSSRAINPEERTALEEKYPGVVMASRESEHVIALDGLAVIVHENSPARYVALTLDQIAGIFSGEIRDWAVILGGRHAPIVVHSRNDDPRTQSGTFVSFREMVLRPRNRQLAATAIRHENGDRLSEEVAQDKNAIGFIGLAYIREDTHAVPIAVGCGMSHRPTSFGVKTGVYPLSRSLYLYTLGTPQNPLALAILDFAMSEAAQDVVRQAEFIDQNIELEDQPSKDRWLRAVETNPDPRATTPEIQAIMQNLRRHAGRTQRASINFRFTFGSDDLDPKALADARRLATYLRSPQMRGRRWQLVGFADSDGSFEWNLELSRRRAVAVGRVLARERIPIRPENYDAYSWLAPIGCDNDDIGKTLNRRVEVWIDNP